MNEYDYIITGAGAAGLMLAYRMSLDPYFDDKRILLLDKEAKNIDDRTWCYWERGSGEWDHLCSKTWDEIKFASAKLHKNIPLGIFKYKLIRSSAFYAFVKEKLAHKRNFHFYQESVTKVNSSKEKVTISTANHDFEAKIVFNSILKPEILEAIDDKPYPNLKQHFIGWFIETSRPVFDPDVATFMDFDLPQNGNSRFMYVLPFSKNKALVEYTLFSKDILEDIEYETAIEDYLKKHGISEYVITEKERGIIPMTTYPFVQLTEYNVINIGTAGGWAKACTGYTFANTMRNTKILVEALKTNTSLTLPRNRFWYYDHIMLNVLQKDNSLGSNIFSSIFKNNKIEVIFDFLDSKSTFFQDLKLMLTTKPRLQFTLSFIRSFPLFIKSIF